MTLDLIDAIGFGMDSIGFGMTSIGFGMVWCLETFLLGKGCGVVGKG
jgi:hypothetical protein